MKITERKLKSIIRSVINESNEFINTSLNHSLEDAAEKCSDRILEIYNHASPEDIRKSIEDAFSKNYSQYSELTELTPSEYEELISLSIIELVIRVGAGTLMSPF